MDDLTLLDLLECPVCFEKLDVTAKVLPCQHTFCKPCLQRIFKAHKELRCPECRTLVFCSIEALPANLLLVRLLDGVRSGQSLGRGGSFRRPGVLTAQDGRRGKSNPRALQSSSFRLVPNIRIHMDGDDIITVISRVDENWAEGKLGDKVGIFPILFVEPNLTARHLLEKNKGRQSVRTKNLSLVPSSSRGKAANTPTLRRGPGSRRKGPGQFSITTALNTLNRMVHSPSGRHMVEISTPVLISSSNPSVITQHTEKGDIPPSSVGQVSTYHSIPGSPGHSAAIVNLSGSQQHLSANMFVALHSYSAHGPDELDLQKGEGIRVLGRYPDGWLRGVSLVTGRVGTFPNNYVIPIFRKTSSFPDSRSPGLYATWTLSNSSVSSQGSISEGDPRQNRPFKSVFVPTAIVNPVRSTTSPGTVGQGSLRRSGRSSMRKNGSLQRPVQSGIPALVVGSLRRSPTMVVRPQQFPFYQPQGVPPAPSTVVAAELGPQPTPTGEPALTCVSRGGDTRTRSAASSLIMEGKEIPVKSEPLPKPPASAPPSILVKPENSRNGSEKQVKTVRFQNYSPPPAKQYTSHPTSGKPEQPAIPKGSQPEAAPSGPEMTVLFAHRSGCHSGQQTDLRRKSTLGKTTTPVSTASATQTVFPSK
ncbi:E3 ubiquitin-protein ligase SH3RF2 isoform X6 [Prionailurus bengalensis]|uniref:E3 ubiquitin-protein ligase SH3RF2 isoform X6 n=1 Tax=Prionailurus bengalensis TaxID=37029 RepID=UPI001CA97D7E|nr:E3 ubiquitin-protein ligase SH3RF2 isoform X6 [Prionailurus bengalensis]XP_043446119.1 E3 ubiquitin-protein ligase SH3RF2 isoform X6 [Prionailurus bengalensis]